MKAGTLLLIVRDIVNGLVAMKLLSEDGDFVSPTTQQDFEIAAMVEGVLKTHGVGVPNEIDRIVASLPLIWSIIGHKFFIEHPNELKPRLQKILPST